MLRQAAGWTVLAYGMRCKHNRHSYVYDTLIYRNLGNAFDGAQVTGIHIIIIRRVRKIVNSDC
jgi:hypothetical protein